MGGDSNVSLGAHLKGIHETVKAIKLELEDMRKDIKATNSRGDSSSVDGGSVTKPPNGSQTRKRQTIKTKILCLVIS